MSRRGFLKKSALASLMLGTACSGLVGCASSGGTAEERNLLGGYQYEAETAEGEWHHSACQRNCFDTCMIKSKVVDGRLVQVRGDETNPYTAGGLCVKTQSYVDWCYSKDRILYPLKRTGEKGPGCTFERISWDEAIETITSTWKDIIANYGGEAITWSRYQGNQGALNRRVLEPLFFRMGATYNEASMCNNGYVFSLPYTTGTVPVMRAEEIAEKDLYISWAHNPAAASLHTMKFIKEMNKKGGKIVVVNPIRTPEVMWADLYVQLKPGTDIAFALGVGKYLIDNGMYDQAFVDEWAVGFEDYRASCEEWSAEKVADVCGIPAEQVGAFAEILWERRENACLKTGLQLGRRRNGGMSHISVKCLSGLIGHPECYFNMTSSSTFDNSLPSLQSTMLQGKLPSEANPVGTIRNYSSPALGKALTGVNYGEDHNFADNPIRSIMIFGNNPLVSHPNQNLVREGLAREDLFTVVHDMFMTPSCDYADIILPAPSNFEYEEFNAAYGHNYGVINEAIIEPLGESVANWELCNMLGRAMGYDDAAFSRTPEDFRELFMKGKPLTYEELLEQGWYYAPPKSWSSVYEGGFPTPSKKFQFASDELEHDHGTRAPRYTADPEGLDGDESLLAKYPLALLSPSAKEFLNGCFGNLPDNNILFHESYVYLNAEDAAERGIADGDAVVVYNDRGTLHRIARVMEGQTAPHTVYTYKSTWPSWTGVENANCVTSDEQADIGRGVTFMSCLVEVAKE
jgi:anaerobic selenocysteine-containing dehydrogenase